MLGEDHSLLNEFSKFKDKINQLNQSDQKFADQAQRYHELDSEVRELELKNSPIIDDDLHRLKQERALLKDVLYRTLISK